MKSTYIKARILSIEDLCFSSAEEAKAFSHNHCKDYVTWVGLAEEEEEE